MRQAVKGLKASRDIDCANVPKSVSTPPTAHGGRVYDESEFKVVQPDVIYFGAESARRINLREHVRFTPDLAIEVLSPSTSRNDRGRKRDVMVAHGVPED